MTLEEAAVQKLRFTQQILATVESCTGGLIADLITNVSGASEVFWGTFVTYDNSAKEDLGVARELIASQGAVSYSIAKDLSERGLLKMENAYTCSPSFSLVKPKGFVCLSTTGIAGPGGGTQDKPVGLCFIAIAASGKKTVVVKFQSSPPADRRQIKVQFAQRALELLQQHLKEL